MGNHSITWANSLAGCLLSLAAPWLGSSLAYGAVDDVRVLTPEPLPAFRVRVAEWTQVAQAEPAAKAAGVTLAECVQIALNTQPALAAARASLAAALSAQQALENLRIVGLVSREIPIRRKQAALGVGIAAAEVSQAEWEATYAVTRNFFSVQYARKQQQVASDVIEQLRATYLAAKAQVDAGSRDVTNNDLVKISTYQATAELRLQDAKTGVARATAALREAMGVGQDYPLDLVTVDLPTSSLSLTRDQVISEALARRGEVTQVMNVAEVTCLEVEAQGVMYSLTGRTFAAAADVHARPVPQGERNGNYRPDALGVEMPTMLAGHRRDRMNRARDLNVRANAVVEKTRNLVALEAGDSFLKWQDATLKVAKIEKAAKDAKELGKTTQKDFASRAKVTVKDVLDTLVLGEQTQASANEVRYQQILALAALERITAGGVQPEWSARPAPHK
jgi:outer membrane protein TolC